MPEMKRCKECGKLFLPKGREVYCSEDHYRPCPICGEPVIVNYFSDPPRKCDACKWRKIKPLPKELSVKSKSLFKFVPKDGTGDSRHTAAEALKQEIEIVEEMSKKAPEVSSEWMNEIDTSVQQKVDQAIFCETTTGSIRMYIGNPHGDRHFIPGHKYVLRVEHNAYTYRVTSTEDITAGEPVKIVSDYASQISFYQNFAKLKEA